MNLVAAIFVLWTTSFSNNRVKCLKMPHLEIPLFGDYGNSELSSNYDKYGYVIINDEDLATSPLSQIVIQKCRCRENEVLFLNKCIPHTGSYIPFQSPSEPYNTYLLNETLMQTILSDTQCPEEYIMLDAGFESFTIDTSGTLLLSYPNLSFNSTDYCLENVKNSMNQIDLMATICIAPPPIQRCCSPGEGVDQISRKCTARPSESRSGPPIFIGDMEVELDYWYYNAVSTASLNCSEGEKMDQLDLNDDNFVFYNDLGTLLQVLPYQLGDYISVPSEKFCLDSNSYSSINKYKVIFCYEDPREKLKKYCSDSSCVRKCCPDNSIVNEVTRYCEPFSFEIDEQEENKTLGYGFPLCRVGQHQMKPSEWPEDEFSVMENGSLFFPFPNTSVPPQLYCIDKFLREDSSVATEAMVCIPEEPMDVSYCHQTKTIIYQTFLVVSSVFLLLALVIYVGVPDLKKNIFQKCLAAHIASLLSGFVFLIILQWATQSINMTTCICFGIFMQFSFLCSFFWLNVLCYDITSKCMNLTSENGSEASRILFLKYNLYGWGCPLLISVVTITMQMLPTSYRFTNLILPGFGETGCWFKDNASTWAYFNGIVLALIATNIFLFLATAAIFINSTVKMWRSMKRHMKERFILSFKIFAVTGLTWLCEVVHGQIDVVCVDNSFTFWMVPDLINAMKGLCLFLILITKEAVQDRIKFLVKKLVNSVKCLLMTGSNSNSFSPCNVTSKIVNQVSTRRLSAVGHEDIVK